MISDTDEANFHSRSEISCQTNEDLIYNYAWSKYYQHFVNYYLSTNSLKENEPKLNVEITRTDNEPTIEKLDAESIRKIAESSLESKGFLYDPQTNLYYDTQNALYYDQVPFYYEEKKCNRLKSLLNYKALGSDLNLEEDRQIKSNSEPGLSSGNESSDHENERSIDLKTKFPPCIRAILIESDLVDESENSSHSNKLGSLFLIPFTGGLIGNSKSSEKSYVINFPGEIDVDEKHVTIRYESNTNSYFVQDENSKNGTFLNASKLESHKEVEIKHGDKLNIGKSICLLLHIHEGSNTCINCEPGEVMHRLKLEKENINKILSKLNEKSREELRRENVKLIKTKYGLNDETLGNSATGKYMDRAKQRRKEKGIDLSHIEASNELHEMKIDKKLDKDNKGLQLLTRMGWKEGQGLGKNESGITEPIKATIKLGKRGLGSQVECKMEIDQVQKMKIINWNKTKERFQSVQDNYKIATVFNVDDEDDE